ncbi:MAG: DUF4270 family protein [Lacibacter sp.]
MNFFSSAYKRRNLYFVVAGLLMIVFSGCTKLESTRLGGDLLPGSDGLITDTIMLPVSTTSFIESDTAYAVKGSNHILGYINDPVFGTTTASMFFQLLPTLYPFSYPVSKDSLFLDSCVLSLSFTGTYGDTNTLSKVNLYKITDPTFKAAKKYQYNQAASFSTSDLLGSGTFSAHSLRTGYKAAYKTDTIYNQLRIRLNDAFAQLLLEQDNVNGAFRSDSIFKVFLNGFALVPDSTQSGNAIHYFSLTGSDTKINLYYRYKLRTVTTATWDTTVTTFTFVNDTVRSANANKIYRNYNGSLAQPAITSGVPSSMAYVLTTPGTSVKIKIPGLDTLNGRPYIIHRAEIVARQIYQGPVSVEQILTQPVLHLFSYDASGNITTIPQDSIGYFTYNSSTGGLTVDNAYTGGYPSYISDNSGNTIAEYKLNITRFVQGIVTNKTSNRDFKLSAPNYAVFSNGYVGESYLNPLAHGRVQLGGGTHPTQKMFVRIYYSKQ